MSIINNKMVVKSKKSRKQKKISQKKTLKKGGGFVNNVNDEPWFESSKKRIFFEKLIQKSMELANNYIPEKKEGDKKYRKNAKKRINDFILQNKEKLKQNYEEIRTYDFAKFIAKRFIEHMDEHIKKKSNNSNLEQDVINDIKKLVEDILTKNKIQELIDNHIKSKIISSSSYNSYYRRW
jgi:hypothetical protein